MQLDMSVCGLATVRSVDVCVGSSGKRAEAVNCASSQVNAQNGEVRLTIKALVQSHLYPTIPTYRESLNRI